MPPLKPRSSHLGLILPLCTSSATLGMSVLQYPLFFAFLQPKAKSSSAKAEQAKISGLPLSHFWASFLAPAGTPIAGVAFASLHQASSLLAG